MRIGLISAEFPPERGGVQTYAWQYARELATRGHEITVFTTPHPGGEADSTDFEIKPVLQLRRYKDRRHFMAGSFDVWHSMNAAYSWLALETRPVFVTVHGNDFLTPYQPTARLDLRERFHLPFGSNLDRWLGDRLTKLLVNRSLPRTEKIFCNSQYTESRLIAEVPACRGKTTPAMVGVADSYFAQVRPPRRPGPARLITVSRLSERQKNVDLTLRALATLKGSFDFHYTVVGDGEFRPSFEALAKELELEDRVTFTGFVDQPQLFSHLLDSDLFILTTSATPYAYEGFGLVYIEANACGCPALAARVAGAAEAVNEGLSGFFVNEISVASVAESISRFLSGSVSFKSEDCVAFARRFTWAQVVDHCLPYYERSLRTSK